MTARHIIWMLSFWLAGWPRLLGAAEYSVAFSCLDGGQWQIWTVDPRSRQSRRLTTSPADKRYLRAPENTGRLYFRDNQGKLFSLDPLQPGQEKPMLPDLEVVKDFDIEAQRGFLISSYASNANDNLRIWWLAANGQGKRLVIGEPYLNEAPRWLPGTDAFLFVKSHRGNSAIYRASLDLTHPPVLWHESRDPHSDPAPAPAGPWVAFCRETRGNVNLWVASLDGSQPREVYAGPGLEAEPCWSPAGDWLVFSTWDGTHFRIARIRPDGSGFEFLSPAHTDARYPICYASLKGSS
jgi:Tol biopolymer transport system component